MTLGPPVAEEPTPFPLTSFEGMTQVASNAYPDQSALPYDVPLPREAGPPLAVWVSDPKAYPPGVTEVVAEYDKSAVYGPFRIRDEQLPTGSVDQDWIDGIPRNCSTCSDARLVDLGNGISGALMYGPPRPTSITWLEGANKLIVIGPGDLSEDQAIKISSEVAAGLSGQAATG